MSYDSVGWELEPGAARDIGVGADGSVWVVGTGAVPGGFGMAVGRRRLDQRARRRHQYFCRP